MTSLQQLKAELIAQFGSALWIEDDSARALVSEDVFYRCETIAAVVKPRTRDQVSAIVQAAHDHGVKLAVRGGGASYSGGYLAAEPEQSVTLDLSGLNQIVEISADDMYVLVEPGCTWEQLRTALEPRGLRAAFWGPLSGFRATVGGAISQNAIFWGAGTAGSAADNVLGLEVVLGDGGVVRTGSFAARGAKPFTRHFGPDLSGLFTSDAGAMGVKTLISLRLVRIAPVRKAMSILLPTADALCRFMAEISRSGLAAQQMGMDGELRNTRMSDSNLIDDIGHFWGVLRRKGVGAAWRLATAGRGVLDAMDYSAHIFLEGRSEAAVEADRQAVLALAEGLGGQEVPASVPDVMAARPFAPLNGVTGVKGERWVPVHAVLPLSEAQRGYQAIANVFAAEAEEMKARGVATSFLFTSIGTNAFVIEPMFLWQDALGPLHDDVMSPKRVAGITRYPENLETRDYVAGLRAKVAAAVDEIGAVHMQLGSFYRYTSRLDDGSLALFERVQAACGHASELRRPQLQ